jgi:glycine/D-amino acid oxidase-like deaminating enzyme
MISSEQYSQLVPLASPSKFGAVKIKGSSVIDTRLYLRLLWDYVQSKYRKAEWRRQIIDNLDTITSSSDYDLVIVSPGSSIATLWPSLLPYLHLTIGYHLVYPDPGAAPPIGSCVPPQPLQYALLSGEYMIPHPSRPNYLLCGATKETTSYHSPRKELSLHAIKPRLHPFLCELYPALETVEPIETWGGIRTFIKRKPRVPATGEKGERYTPPALPLIDRHPVLSHVWLMTGFGSRGLIHHSITGDYLAQAIKQNDISLVPKELRLEE